MNGGKPLSKKTKKIIKTAIIAVLIISSTAAGFLWWKKNASGKTQAPSFRTARVTRGNLDVVLKSSGTLEPVEDATINLKVDGRVKKVYIKEGDVVKKGDLLYELQDDELEIELQKARISVSQQQLNLEEALKDRNKTEIYAPENGVITAVDVKPGDLVSSGTVLATLENREKAKVRAPFNPAQIKSIKVGQKADVLFLDSLYSVEGKVTGVDKAGTPSAGGGVYYYATITIEGNYYVEGQEQKVQVTVDTQNGSMQAVEEVILEPQETFEVKPQISAAISKVLVEEGDYVKKGQKLFSLDTSDVDLNIEKMQRSLEQAKLDLASKMKQLDDLKIYSPIDGTVIEQNIREGDLIKPSSNSSSEDEKAAVIVNYSKMQVVVPIDELDINKVKEGMPVKVTAEAAPGKVFEGVVEKIAEQGVSQNNVSTFDVTVSLDKTPELKAGMTVDVEIPVASARDVLMLPAAAIQERNGKSFVMPAADKNAGNRRNRAAMAPSQGGQVEVKTGLRTEDYVVIESGLKEGDVVLIPSNSGNSGFTTNRRQPVGGPPMFMR
jgi:HlyD family secretion protein